MRYRLRTLLILLAVLPPLLAWGWGEYDKYRERMRRQAIAWERLDGDWPDTGESYGTILLMPNFDPQGFGQQPATER
jgi:hypothetical protein